MVVSSYQSVSGAGQPGMRELEEQWTKGAGEWEALRRAGAGGPLPAGQVWSKPIAGNVIPLAGSVKEAGYTSEEWKLVQETRKILHDDSIAVTATCVRVPVFVGHAMAANLEFGRPVSKAEAVELLSIAPGRGARRRRRRGADAAGGRRHRPGARRPPAGRTRPGPAASTCG